MEDDVLKNQFHMKALIFAEVQDIKSENVLKTSRFRVDLDSLLQNPVWTLHTRPRLRTWLGSAALLAPPKGGGVWKTHLFHL